VNNEKEVKNVILHEIAHALTPKQHHNKIWKLKAISIGCDGKRCYNTKIINSVKGKYIYQCPMCKRKFNRHRKIKQIRSCGLCCNKYNNGNYSSDFNLIYLGKEK